MLTTLEMLTSILGILTTTRKCSQLPDNAHNRTRRCSQNCKMFTTTTKCSQLPENAHKTGKRSQLPENVHNCQKMLTKLENAHNYQKMLTMLKNAHKTGKRSRLPENVHMQLQTNAHNWIIMLTSTGEWMKMDNAHARAH